MSNQVVQQLARRILIPFILFGGGPVNAGLIVTVSPTVTPITGGFEYLYTVSNDLASTEAIFDISLVGLGALVTDIILPNGWTVITALGFIGWSSTDPAFDIQPGGTLDLGFSSAYGPGPGTYLALGGVDFAEGVTVVPVTEPGPALLLGLGLITMLRGRGRDAL